MRCIHKAGRCIHRAGRAEISHGHARRQGRRACMTTSLVAQSVWRPRRISVTPTEDQLDNYYLKETALRFSLADMAKRGEREWYFFVHRDNRSGHGGKPNRATENGYRKATVSDRKIMHFTDPKQPWDMEKLWSSTPGKPRKAAELIGCWATSLKVLEQRAEEHAARLSSILPSYVSQIDFSTPLLSLQDLDYGAVAEKIRIPKGS
ncbi:hypothetical protein F3Y22_tig00110387pilonHSYRG01050 [Hibiscus syriacus]|uniref:NAC domain-containing protein n=1 Tax=Hibiscus syriacus TaxID=106335 RepID=A0A6A3AR95_HIBSY|nr:hypothetical protein F3Y22_tig00110387pilonHSYRG01050 [Hibiscus syriacus]